MACCMFAAFIVGHLALMWRSLGDRWWPERAAARAARPGASAWRPGIAEPAVPVATRNARRSAFARPVGVMLILVSLSYFAVQARDALEQAGDARSFAILLTQNICRVGPEKTPQQPVRLAQAAQLKNTQK